MAIDNFGQSTAAFAHDALLAGSLDVVADSVTLISGTVALTRGALLGQLTTGGKWTLFARGAADGSQVPRAILAETTDASLVDKTCLVYLAGEFDENTMSTNSGAVAANSYSVLTADQQLAVKDSLKLAGIYFKQNVRIA